MEQISIPELESALHFLDASDYDLWIAVGAALAPWGDTGFRLWDDWSRKYNGYRERDAVRKWRSLRNSRSHPKTVLKYAQQAGWRSSGPFSAPPPAIPTPAPRTTTERPITAHLARLCSDALPLSHSDAEAARLYFEHRELGSILQDLPGNVRFHPRLSYHDGQEVTHHPAILARIQDAGGQLAGIHRTYLTPDGRKADVPEPKKILGKMPPGSRIELYRWLPGHPMAIAEGLETALAIRIADFPANVWCVVSAHGMASFTPPEGVSRLDIYADRDKSEAGIQAARKLQQRMNAAGIPYRVLEPSDEQCREVFALRGPLKSVDWLDVFATRGEL